MSLYARVAVPRPIYPTFLYKVPVGLEDTIREGSRVVVPFGRRELTGWVDQLTREPDERPARIREVLDLPDPEPVLDPELLDLCRWVARYYVAPLGLAFRTALPATLTAESTVRVGLASGPTRADGLGTAEQQLIRYVSDHEGPVKLRSVRRDLGGGAWSRTARRLAEKGLVEIDRERPEVEPPVPTRQIIRLERELPSLQERDEIFGRARRQRELYEYLESVGGRAEVAHVTDRLGMSRSVVHGLVDRGLAIVQEEKVNLDPLAERRAPSRPEHVPTRDQAAVVRRLVSSLDRAPPGVFVLKGVTSSGKTLVYIELLREVVERRGRGAIVLVPEIALTPQTLARFRSAFGDQVALLHSALSEGERYQSWQALRAGEKRIVIGARSAVFAPVHDLGAIILDEEHEGSYKQSDPAPRYHARDVAIVRARRSNAVCLLGSATPSLESWSHARTGRWELLELRERIGARPLPRVEVLDLREERKSSRRNGRVGPVVLSERLRSALEDRLSRREQAILLLNRRGYAAFMQCRDCGTVLACDNCNVSLTYHRRPARLVCHYCNHREVAPARCPECGSEELSDRGVGTEQVERVLDETFPRARTARMDVDTTSAKWSHHEILDRVRRHEVDILLGTQMIAKGLDFPNVTLVGVVNADVGLNLPDFRAGERTFQLLTQVAGRAGRGEGAGEVFVQTALPNHYSIRHAVEHDYEGFARLELDERLEPSYPPHIRIANIVVSGTEEGAVQEAAEAASRWLRGLLERYEIETVRLVGPAPCPIDRIRGRWRWHSLLKARQATALGKVLRYFAHKFKPGGSGLRVEIDRDPLDLL